MIKANINGTVINNYQKIHMDLKSLEYFYKCLINSPDFEGRSGLLDLFRVNIKETLFDIEMEKERLWEKAAQND